MVKPLVSVIIPLYNAGLYIEECVNSILAQTWPNIEIIIIDDGSTDNSFEVVKKLENEKIKLLKQENSGASCARNYGLTIAKGKYIQFMDADDLLSKNKIEDQVLLLEKNPDHIAVCATIHFEDGTNPYRFIPIHEWYSSGSENTVDFLIKLYGGGLIGEGYGGMIQPNAWLTPASVINKAGLWNEMRSPDDDGEFFCRVLLASKGICYAADALNYYRKFTGQKSLSAQKNLEASTNILKCTDLKTAHLLNKTNDERAKLAMSRLYWENAFSFYPSFKNLSAEAEKKAKKLAPYLRINPFNKGIKLFISKIIGWKAVKLIQFYNNRQNLT